MGLIKSICAIFKNCYTQYLIRYRMINSKNIEDLENMLSKIFGGNVSCNVIYDTNHIITGIVVTITYQGGSFFCISLSNYGGDLQIGFEQAPKGAPFIDVFEKMGTLNSVFVKRRNQLLDLISNFIGQQIVV